MIPLRKRTIGVGGRNQDKALEMKDDLEESGLSDVLEKRETGKRQHRADAAFALVPQTAHP
jgi:hypothetical protein